MLGSSSGSYWKKGSYSTRLLKPGIRKREDLLVNLKQQKNLSKPSVLQLFGNLGFLPGPLMISPMSGATFPAFSAVSEVLMMSFSLTKENLSTLRA